MADLSLPERLRSQGYRLTPQRQMVLDAVIGLGHATPDEIGARIHVSAPGVNITTVYRTLELLEELGLVRHTHLGHGPPTYHASDDDHVHTVCHRCGTVASVPSEQLDAVVGWLAEQRGFVVDVGHIALSGYCTACASSALGGSADLEPERG
ncbi:MAG: Fur family transcriptional regulator [Geodermatophilaceae bacterium]